MVEMWVKGGDEERERKEKEKERGESGEKGRPEVAGRRRGGCARRRGGRWLMVWTAWWAEEKE